MNQSRRGGWQSAGDNVKVLATYNDDFSTIMSKMIMAQDCSFDESLLICCGSLIKQETFVNLGHFFEAAHVKPGKLLFGIASHREVSIVICRVFACILMQCKLSDTLYHLLLALGVL